jgi:hypothetical protein
MLHELHPNTIMSVNRALIGFLIIQLAPNAALLSPGCKRGLGNFSRLPQHPYDRTMAAFLGPLFRRRIKL